MWRFVRVVLLALVLLGIAPVARGQEMEARLYMIPMQTISGWRAPMYLQSRMNPDGLAVQRSTLDYGAIDLACVAVYTETADHEWLAVQADVYPIPMNLDVNVPQSEVSALQSYLEAYGVPGDWTSPSITWRDTLRTIGGMFLYMQRLKSVTGGESPLDWGYTLNTQWRNVNVEHQSALIGAAEQCGYDTSFIGSNALLRSILRTWGDAWGDAPINFTFITL